MRIPGLHSGFNKNPVGFATRAAMNDKSKNSSAPSGGGTPGELLGILFFTIVFDVVINLLMTKGISAIGVILFMFPCAFLAGLVTVLISAIVTAIKESGSYKTSVDSQIESTSLQGDKKMIRIINGIRVLEGEEPEILLDEGIVWVKGETDAAEYRARKLACKTFDVPDYDDILIVTKTKRNIDGKVVNGYEAEIDIKEAVKAADRKPASIITMDYVNSLYEDYINAGENKVKKEIVYVELLNEEVLNRLFADSKKKERLLKDSRISSFVKGYKEETELDSVIKRINHADIRKKRQRIIGFSLLGIACIVAFLCIFFSPRLTINRKIKALGKEYNIDFYITDYRKVYKNDASIELTSSDYYKLSKEKRGEIANKIPNLSDYIWEYKIYSNGKVYDTNGLTIAENEELLEERIKNKDLDAVKTKISIRIPYRTQYGYRGPLTEYGIEIQNNSPYYIRITSVEIKESREWENKKYGFSTTDDRVNLDIFVGANSTRNTYFCFGTGKRDPAGSYTIAGNVYGGDAYYCSDFSFEILE